MKSLLVLGAGGHAKVCLEIALKMRQWEEVYLLDDFKEGFVFEKPILGKIDLSKYDSGRYEIFVAIGDNESRKSIMNDSFNQDFSVVSLIDPSAIISDYATIGKGTVVMPGVVINADALVGQGCIINTSSVVEHDCNIGPYTHISPNATISGTVNIGSSCWIGAGATINNNLEITNNVIVGSGAVVTSDINEEGTYVGVPARRMDDKF